MAQSLFEVKQFTTDVLIFCTKVFVVGLFGLLSNRRKHKSIRENFLQENPILGF